MEARLVDLERGTPRSVLVVGAGVAGLVAARTLADHGVDVTVVDKARGVGGRLATRRLGDGASFDHGAALFDSVSEPFRRHPTVWEGDGLVERTGIDGRGGVPTRRVKGPATSLAKHLALGLDIRLGAKGVALALDGEGFTLTVEDGTSVCARAVLLTAPVPGRQHLPRAGVPLRPRRGRTAPRSPGLIRRDARPTSGSAPEPGGAPPSMGGCRGSTPPVPKAESSSTQPARSKSRGPSPAEPPFRGRGPWRA